jgi:flagellin
MGLRINSNVPALNAAQRTQQNSGLLSNSLLRLSSGLRINRAADDAAGLAAAERFNTLARQSQVESNNFQTSINVVQTAEGGLSTQGDAVQRLRELSLQASNGTLTDSQREAINAEAQQLLGQIDETASNTEFNGTQLLDGSTPTLDVGSQSGAQVSLPESTTSSLGIDTLDLSTAGGAAAALDQLDTAQQRIDESRSSLGAQQNRFESAIETRQIQRENALSAESAIRDLDFARATIDRTRSQVLLQSSVGALVQGNVTPQAALSLLGG